MPQKRHKAEQIISKLREAEVSLGKLQHYIGKHRDSVQNMIRGAPIVTISLGETRMFRLRPWKEKGFSDFVAESGAVFLIPYVPISLGRTRSLNPRRTRGAAFQSRFALSSRYWWRVAIISVLHHRLYYT